MVLARHESAKCPGCRSLLRFGVTAEPTRRMVVYECENCAFERRVGRLPPNPAESRSELRARAAGMWDRL